MRTIINPHQKAKIALAAVKGNKTFAELGSEYQIHPSRISEWRDQLETRAHLVFTPDGRTKEEQRVAELERMIGQRETEIDWLKKKMRLAPT